LTVADATSTETTERRRLVLVRHAKSSWDDPGLADHDRPLAARGRKALGPMRHHLGGLGLPVDLVLCSSSRRTVETLDGIRSALGAGASVVTEDGLYGATAERLLARLHAVADAVRCVVVVAHNPGVADLLGDLLAGDPASPDSVPTGAVAVLSFEGPWRLLGQADVTLDGFWRPPRVNPPATTG
jgi:phosphohistidine phosphatase